MSHKLTRADEIYDLLARARLSQGRLGLRDTNKLDKLDRISRAARMLFSQQGYEGATLRAIAQEGGVALGTLPFYISDKRDLIPLIFNQLAPPLLERGMRAISSSASLVDNLLALFQPFYEAYARDVTLYRIVLGHIYASQDSVHLAETQRIRNNLIDKGIGRIIALAIASGECAAPANLQMVCTSFYYIYFASVRYWLSSTHPKPSEGLAELTLLYRQHLAGAQAW